MFTHGLKLNIGKGADIYVNECNTRKLYRKLDEYSVFQVDILALLNAHQLLNHDVVEHKKFNIYVYS